MDTIQFLIFINTLILLSWYYRFDSQQIGLLQYNHSLWAENWGYKELSIILLKHHYL